MEVAPKSVFAEIGAADEPLQLDKATAAVQEIRMQAMVRRGERPDDGSDIEPI